MKLAPSLHRIGSDYVNCYLVEDDSGITVVDTGIPGQWDDLIQELAMMNRSLDDVRGAVLTHGDPDHIGFAERLRQEAGVPIYVHEDDAAHARGEVKKKVGWGPIKIRPLAGFLWYGARRGALKKVQVREVMTVADGQILDLPGRPQIIHIPGHTPGSVAIYVPSVDALFLGDAMTTGHVLTGAKGPQPAPFTLQPEEALASLTKLDDVKATWVLPGHGAPWDGGLAEALRQVRAAANR